MTTLTRLFRLPLVTVMPEVTAPVERAAEPPPFAWLLAGAALTPLAWLLARPADESADGADW